MTLHLFRDKTAVIIGIANDKIESSISGTLSIGTKTVAVTAGKNISLPHMGDGSFAINFTADDGTAYHGGFISAAGGRLLPQKNLTPRECALVHRIDKLEELYEDMAAKYDELYNKYNTNALNFISD